jgi:hypothetical protein
MKIAISMMDSKAWSELSLSQIGLYDLFKDKYTFNDECSENNIQFPKKEWKKYYSWKPLFDRDIDNLIDLGFMRVVLYHVGKPTVYGFSATWKYYGTDKFIITDKDRRPKGYHTKT